jgi:pilus assembly protein Flp/PilA
MSSVVRVLAKLLKDDQGAALVEYTVLLGILLLAVAATVLLVGGWVNNQWNALQQNLTAAAG